MKPWPTNIALDQSGHNLAGELFKVMTGVTMVHVPYRGEGPALTDMIAGQVQVTFATLTGSLPHVRSGALRLLAVCAKTRSEFVRRVGTGL
jgi:tripartite-type tricarboxylate transporter receptor subunit TctC